MGVRVESFTYNGQQVGGSANGGHAQILERFGFDVDESGNGATASFVCQFLVTGTGYSDLATNCKALEAVLRTPNAKLLVDWGGANQETYDPLVTGGLVLGFNAAPKLTKLRTATDTGLSRGYEFRVSVILPPNYVDPVAGTANGKITASVNLHTDVDQRRVITITGTYTSITNTLARAAYNADINAFAAQRIALIDSTAANWTLTRQDAPDDIFQNVCQFSRDYSEQLNGRRISAPEIHFLPSGQRIVTIRGTYLRTVLNATPFTNTASSVNYAAAVTGGVAFAVTTLAAFTTAQGGALTVGTNCEEPEAIVTTNEQDDRTDYTLIFREILWKQSSVASGLDDPDILNDTVTFVISYNPVDDSPAPPTSGAASPASVQPGPVSGANPTTVDRSAVGPTAPGAGPSAGMTVSSSNGGAAGGQPGYSPVKKPVDLWIRYQATFRKSVTNIQQKWLSVIRPYLIAQWAPQVGVNAQMLVGDQEEPTVTDSTISCVVHAQGNFGDVLALQVSETISDDLGLKPSGAFNGIPHAYLLQQGLPKRVRRRVIKAVYLTNSSFSPLAFATQSAVPGWVVLSTSDPDKITKTTGVLGLGVPQLSLTSEQFVEDSLYVAMLLPGSVAPSGGPVPNGGASGTSPGPVPALVPMRTATGQ